MPGNTIATYTPMTPKQRALFFKVIAGFMPIEEIAFPLEYLYLHLPPRAVDDALEILTRKGLTGPFFVEWFREECAGSFLEMQRKIIAMLEKAKPRPLFAGRDVR